MKHIRLKQMSLRNHPTLAERWVRNVIEEDRSVSGIGEVVLRS